MEKSNVVIASVVLAVSLIVSVSIYSGNLFKIQKLDNTLAVTGSATKIVESDLAKLKSSFSRTVAESKLKEGYAQMKEDEAKVINFLKDNNFGEGEFEISSVSMNEQYNYDKDVQREPRYDLVQRVKVTSNDIKKVQALSKKTDLIDLGVIYQSSNPEYYYTKLPEERVSLLPNAVSDAQKRAKAIAESTDSKVGTLKSASMGVVQVMQPDSVDIESYGSYDTSTIEKQIMITVRANFVLK